MAPGELVGTGENSLYVERASRAILIVDLVESVRHVQENEKRAVSRWLELVRKVESNVLPEFNGRLIKTLGDGLLLDFESGISAAAAAIEIQKSCTSLNTNKPIDTHFQLRMGIEIADVLEDDHDIYGHGVNIAARLMAVASPGEIVVSANARDQLTADLDAEIEDLGNCYLKHVSEPVRAYRIGPTNHKPLDKKNSIQENLLPAIAILPFASHSPSSDHNILGDVIADELIQALSVSQYVKVISRLSTSPFRGRNADLDLISKHLQSNYVLSGSYHVEDTKIRLFVELAEVKSGEVVWSDRLTDKVSDIFADEQDLIRHIAQAVGAAIFRREVRRLRTKPLPTLESYSLLMGAITLMHRMSYRDFEESLRMLELVRERAVRRAVPHAWIAKWYVLRAQQGWSDDPDRDSRLAQDAAKRALDADPESSLALTIDGLVHTHMLKDHSKANQLYQLAVTSNPNNSLAWLLKGTEHAFTGNGPQAVDDTQLAIQLSPLDPHRYYYDTLAATAYLSNHQFELALASAERSLRANKSHTSTIRAKAIACWQLGRYEEAKLMGNTLMKLEPNLTITSWLARSPSNGYEIGNEWAEVLANVGVPK